MARTGVLWLLAIFSLGATDLHARFAAGEWVPGTVQLTPGSTVTVTLNAWGEFRNRGYTVRFTSPNSVDSDTSEVSLTNSAAADTIPFDIVLDTLSLPLSANVTKSNLNINDNKNDIRVKFSGNTTVDQASPHEIKLHLSMSSFDPFSQVAGTYQDTITAKLNDK